MQNGDEAALSINLAGRAILVKMLITLEPHGIFSPNFDCLYILHCLKDNIIYRLIEAIQLKYRGL